MSTIQTIGVVGAGLMGGGIAQVAATSGFRVLVHDAVPAALRRCQEQHQKRLAREVEKGRLTPDERTATLGRLQYVESLDRLRDADALIEAVVEDTSVKKDLFARMAAMFPNEVLLATNTSSISITEIAAAAEQGRTGAGTRVIGMHFFNPVPVMKLVEIVRGLQTSDETTVRAQELARALGKTPITAQDRPGFVANRVLMPMINEAFYAWMEGVADPGSIDEIMKLGCNLPMGPLRLADFIGLDTCAHIMNVMAEGLNNPRYRPCPLLKQLVAAGRLGDKTGRGVYEYGQG